MKVRTWRAGPTLAAVPHGRRTKRPWAVVAGDGGRRPLNFSYEIATTAGRVFEHQPTATGNAAFTIAASGPGLKASRVEEHVRIAIDGQKDASLVGLRCVHRAGMAVDVLACAGDTVMVIE